jgi:hypothetical protein
VAAVIMHAQHSAASCRVAAMRSRFVRGARPTI